MNGPTLHGARSAFDALSRSAIAAGTPTSVAEEARRATTARFPAGCGGRRAERERAEAYFWGVVRRRALAGQAPEIARLIVAASVASEMREAGHRSTGFGGALT